MTVVNPGGGTGIPAPSANPPANPVDGSLWLLPADAASGVNWTLRYNALSASAHKWELIGGRPVRIEIPTFEGTASVVYTDLPTVGPSFVAPAAGDYDVMVEAYTRGTAAGVSCFMAVAVGAGAASDNDSLRLDCAAANDGVQGSRHSRELNAAAAAAITAKYRTSSGTASFGSRVMTVCPVRLG